MFHVKHNESNLLYNPNHILNQSVFDVLFDLVTVIEKWNKNHHITSVKDRKSIWFRHILDSLQIVHFVQDQKELMDIGSGFGFPTIPLSIVCPEVNFVIVEPNLKKNRLCRYVIQQFGIKNIIIFSERIENLNYRLVDVVCCRAWGEFKKNATIVYPFLKVNGYFITFKQHKENDVVEGYCDLENHPYCLGLSFPEYHIVKMKKEIRFYG